VLDIPTATLILGAATLILSAVIACVTSYIAIQQWFTAKNVLRLHLFDRRLPVFEAAMKLAEIVVTKKNITLEEVQEFSFATKSVQFLFDENLQDYCDKELHKEAYSVWSGKQKIDSLPEGEERDNSMGLWQARIVWFNDQRQEIPKRFAPFLKIRG
jgi:hypothetical protein